MIATGLLVAMLPLSMVWLSSDANKYRKLVWTSVFLIFDLILFGAFTRLSDSGLGCPDWPGCYGLANPLLAHQQIGAAETLLPGGPVTVFKAWIEMTHRYLAFGIGVLIVTIMAQAWRQRRQERRAEFAPWLPTALFGFVCLQGAFGAWTVTQKLQPVIVSIHLLLGMGLLALMTWLGSRQDHLGATGNHSTVSQAGTEASGRQRGCQAALRTLALMAAVLLLIQIALGAWVSTNYATLACQDFPLCGGKLIPEMDFEHGFTLWRALGKTASGEYLPFPALTAIHWVHRSFALVVFGAIGYTAWRASAWPGLRNIARWIAIALGWQACSGIATIYFSFPLAIAVLHNGGAALLVLLLTMLNYRVKFMPAWSTPADSAQARYRAQDASISAVLTAPK